MHARFQDRLIQIKDTEPVRIRNKCTHVGLHSEGHVSAGTACRVQALPQTNNGPIPYGPLVLARLLHWDHPDLPTPMPTALQLAEGHPELTAAVLACRKLLHRRAVVAAAASVVPLPGLDWAVDAALLSRLIPAMNARFGLAPDQIDLLAPAQRHQVHKAITLVGSALVGKFISKELVIRMAQTVAVRMGAKQAARFVPVAGQAVAAVMGYSVLRYLGEEHLKDCVRVALAAQLRLPAPGGAAGRGQ